MALPLAAQTLTPEQLQIFQGLSPEQQQAVLERATSGGSAVEMPGSEPGAGAAAESAERAARASAQAPQGARVLAARDIVTLEVSVRGGAANGDAVRGLVSLILARNPYELDRSAQLSLPGLAPIALGGLTEAQATQRLALEPAMVGLNVSLTRLPVQRPGAAGLGRFGYDLFANPPSTFSPVTNVPVPADYVVGAGDEFNVQLFGRQNRSLQLTVNRDGSINFPELGPINVAGLTFGAARSAIESRVTRQLTGVEVNVSMGEIRAIRVFVLGEARQPGSYTVSGLATMTTALFISGGVTSIGSLRDIQLKRQGQIVRHFDLYDLLIAGDTSDDARLLPGDVIFIPPAGKTVSVHGEVKRPAIYELLEETSMADLVRTAGGFTPDVDPARASLARIDADSRRIVLDVNLAEPAGRDLALRNGDELHVAALRPQLDSGVSLQGFVYRPGLFAWREGMRLTDVIGSVEELKPGADLNYVLIRRESGADRRVSLISTVLTAALAAPGTSADPQLAVRDRIFVFDLVSGRGQIIGPLLDELRLQSDLSRPTEIVTIQGQVKVPGDYPLEPGMRVADLLRAGGNLEPAAYGSTAELTRYTTNASGDRETRLLSIDLVAARRGDPAANVELQPFDHLLVKLMPEWNGYGSVALQGEVRFPGTYPLLKGETLHQLLDRAGGLTAEAFPDGSVFTRSDLRDLEQQQLNRLADVLRSDLILLSVQGAREGLEKSTDALLAGQSLLSGLQAAKATGRFVINLPGLLATEAHSEQDVRLRNGDTLYIPRQRQEVTVIGEVRNSASHLYESSLTRNDYIAVSGGPTRRADPAHVYVVRADGRVAVTKDIRPGDTIVVPADMDRVPRLPFWQAVTQILYNVAISVAAVNSF